MLRKLFKFSLLCSRSHQNLLILINSLFQLPVILSALSVQPWMIQFLFGPALGYGTGGWRMGLPTCSLLHWLHRLACETLEASACLGPRNNQLKMIALLGKKVLCMILPLVFNIEVAQTITDNIVSRYSFFNEQKLRIFLKFTLY